jgi:hypothetical protein
MMQPLQGFTVTLRSEPCIAIEDAVGCVAQVLAGQAWIAAFARRFFAITRTPTV